MKKLTLYVFIITTLLITIGCTKVEKPDDDINNEVKQIAFQALIIDAKTSESTSILVVSQENIGYGEEPTLISFSVPEGKLYDEEDNLIDREELVQGYLIEITSDGVFLESYPLQLGTVYQVKVIGNGSSEEIEKYREQFEYIGFGDGT